MLEEDKDKDQDKEKELGTAGSSQSVGMLTMRVEGEEQSKSKIKSMSKMCLETVGDGSPEQGLSRSLVIQRDCVKKIKTKIKIKKKTGFVTY